MINNILASVDFTVLQQGVDISLNWLGHLIKWIIESVGITGVGIIFYTVILKLITLPLDIYSKKSMRKQSIQMDELRPKLEKLQKQCGNDNRLYQEKVQQVYKENGVNMAGACLPTLITLVIFFVVFNQFNAYSQYSNVYTYNRMIESYNSAVLTYCVDENDVGYSQVEARDENGNVYYVYTSEDSSKFIYYIEGAGTSIREYKLDVDKCYAYASAEIDALMSEKSYDKETACSVYVKTFGRNAAEKTFYENQQSFLWVKNIWYPDTTAATPVKDYESFVSSVNSKVIYNGEKVQLKETPAYSTSAVYDEITYNLVTGDDAYGNTNNGLYILVALSILGMLAQQFMTKKSQKGTENLQTADGQGASSQKMMMIIMPVMFGLFAFSYSASFSIYMIVNIVVGMGTTAITNLIIDRQFANYEREMMQKKYDKRIVGITHAHKQNKNEE